jgi:DNA-binding transcriptional ArsR family regulator
MNDRTQHLSDEDEEIVVEDLETFRVIDNPLRQRIMHVARRGRSVKEIAGVLGLPVTRLYYHVNMLEEAGLLEVEDVRKSGAQLERVYRSRRGTVVPSPEFVDSIGDPQEAARVLAGALFDNTRVEVEAVLVKHLTEQKATGALARMVLQVPDEMAEQFAERIEQLAAEIREAARETDTAGDEGRIYSFTFAFVPTDPA